MRMTADRTPGPFDAGESPARLTFSDDGAGSPLVLLHGLADHGGVWRSTTARLDGRHRCLAPDLRGHGESDKPDHGYDATTLATDLEHWARSTGVERADVVAHSWAAKVALVWARRSPGRLRRLFLVDPFFVNRLPALFRPTLPVLYRTLPFLRAMGPFPSYEAASEVARRLKQYRSWTAAQQDVFREGMEETPDGRWRSKFTVAARNGVFDDMLRTDGLTDTLDVPTTLLLPERGLNKTKGQLAAYRRHVPDLAVHRIPGNHWPHLVEPAAFGATLERVLERG